MSTNKRRANNDIREMARIKGVFLWQIADRMNISEPTMTRKLRRELPVEEKKRIFDVINAIAEGE